MAVDPLLPAVAASAVFTDSAAAYLLLDPTLRIVAVNDAYQVATRRPAEDVVGQELFDAFPDNPADPAATGVRNLGASLEQVLHTGAPHDMLVQRYDVRTGSSATEFVEKIWSPVNSPLLDEHGRVVGLIHHVEDVTGLATLTVPFGAPDPGHAGWGRGEAIRSALLATQRPDVQDVLVRENRRLRSGLTTLAAARGMFGVRDPLVDRRRQLWERGAAALGAGGWAGWTGALCEQVVACLPGIDAAAVSARSGRAQEIVAATTDWAQELEQLHYTLGEGPAVTAYDNRLPVMVADLSRHQHDWPAYVQAAVSVVTGVFVLPLLLQDVSIGTLSLYAWTSATIPAARWSDAVIIADLMTPALMIDLDASPADRPGPGLGALHRVAVAAGMLAAQRQLTVDQATALLRARAFTQNRPIGHVADDIINRRLPPEE